MKVNDMSLIANALADYQRKQVAWDKATPLIAYPENYRMDAFQSIIRWEDYGNASSAYGWEIDHITPVALGGSDDPSNLRALHCKVNRGLGGLLGGLLNR